MSISPMWYNIDCSQLMFQFVCYQLQLIYPTVEHHLVRNLQHETSKTIFDTFNKSQHLPHTLHESVLHFSCVFTFLEIIKHNMRKCRISSSIFNIKMPAQKFTNFDKFFKKCTLIWQLSQHKLTKLFQMKLKTTTCYESRRTEKNIPDFLADPLYFLCIFNNEN